MATQASSSDAIKSIIKPAFLKKCARTISVENLSHETFSVLANIYSGFIKNILQASFLITKMNGRSTLSYQDVINAIENNDGTQVLNTNGSKKKKKKKTLASPPSSTNKSKPSVATKRKAASMEEARTAAKQTKRMAASTAAAASTRGGGKKQNQLRIEKVKSSSAKQKTSK